MIISRQFKVDGVLTDMTSVKFSDPTGTFGVKRTDTGAIVVADGTDLDHDGTGLYSYTLVEPAAGLTYHYWIEFVFNGETYRIEKTATAGVAPDADSYCTVEEADAIADALPGLASYKAASDDAKLAALVLATLDLDNNGPWQGAKYDLLTPQALAFPRVPYPTYAVGLNRIGTISAGEVWDWDSDNNVAIVPADVKKACVLQADSILDSSATSLDSILDDAGKGITSKSVGSLSVSFADAARLLAAGGGGGLARRAAMLMAKYQLRSGGLL